MLLAPERRRVTYILIGAFIQGAEEVTEGIDIVPSMRDENVDRLAQALDDLGAERMDGKELDRLAREPRRGAGARPSH